MAGDQVSYGWNLIFFAQKSLAFAGLTIALIAPAHLQAQWKDNRGRTAAEVSVLPPFCQAKFGYMTSPQEVARWQNAVGGEGWEHIHHYCQGLINTNQALFSTRSPQEKQLLLKASVDEFNYMIANTSSKFVLLPEILMKKGENLIRLNRAPEAVEPLQRAIELKPDYWPPYAVMSDYFKSRKDNAKAREWLEKALAIAPNSQSLRTRWAELGGKPLPPPASKPEAKPEAAKAPPAKTEPAKPEPAPETPKESETEPAAK